MPKKALQALFVAASLLLGACSSVTEFAPPSEKASACAVMIETSTPEYSVRAWGWLKDRKTTFCIPLETEHDAESAAPVS